MTRGEPHAEAWLDRLSGLLGRSTLEGPPLAARARLRAAVRVLESDPPAGGTAFLLLAFGSVARGESAADLDLLLVLDGDEPRHGYWRIRLGATMADFNLASRAWLDRAWEDPERGYWLAEGYVLACGDPTLDMAWRAAADRYRSRPALLARIRENRRAFADLRRAASVARACGRDLFARLLAQEAARSAAMAVVDGFGARTYSHRSFPGEVVHACRRARIPLRVAAALGAALSGRARPEEQRVHYPEIRRRISTVLRSAEVEEGLGYRPAAPRRERLDVLIRAAGSPPGDLLERLLSADGRSWLPEAADPERAATELDTLWEHLPPPRATPPARPRPDDVPAKAGGLAGVRWCEIVDGRLKLILATGGCRTPTCAFCSLPRYGVSLGRAEPVRAVAEALARHRPREMALYNDGSLLDPRELPSADLAAICREIAAHNVARLAIESTPRFVTRQALTEIAARSGVESLAVGMGFQSRGDWFSVGYLGRPDVDALFDRAIDEAQEASAAVRLYLLWGFGGFSPDFWRDRLADSLSWAGARGVEQVTVCPFIAPRRGERSGAGPLLCRLREALATARPTHIRRVTVSLPVEPSCGLEPAGGRCPVCEASLRSGRWVLPPGERCRNR